MLSFYQHLSEHINPIAFSIGNFDIRWYSIMYLVAFCVIYNLLMYRMRREEMKIMQKSKIKNQNENSEVKNIESFIILDFLLYSFVGLIIGGRLGYVLFYNLEYFIQNPLAVISPFDFSGNFVGIFGMSYFGGSLGIILASVLFCRKNEINFWQWADFIVPAIPAGYFFGRIGNFLNGELYGKTTDSIFGMYFSGILRYPTQLLEAFFEGIVLFAILWFLRGLSPTTFGNYPKGLKNKVRKVVGDKSKFPGFLLAAYLFGYGIIRFFVEFLREPEEAPFLGFSTGQILSLAMIIISVIIFLHKTKKPWYNSLNA